MYLDFNRTCIIYYTNRTIFISCGLSMECFILICYATTMLYWWIFIVLHFNAIMQIDTVKQLWLLFWQQVESTQSMIRIVGLSATLPNYLEVGSLRNLSILCRSVLFCRMYVLDRLLKLCNHIILYLVLNVFHGLSLLKSRLLSFWG